MGKEEAVSLIPQARAPGAMKTFAIDLFVSASDRWPSRTVQVPAASVEEAMRKAKGTMADNETALKPSASQPANRLLDIKV